jgi:hypothetical protein
MVVHGYNPSEAEIGRTVVQDKPWQKSQQDPISTNNLGMVVYVCNASYTECLVGRLKSEAGLRKTCEPLSEEIT